MLVGDLAQRLEVVDRIHGPTLRVVGVLDGHDSGAGQVVERGPDRRGDVLGIQHPPAIGQGPGLRPACGGEGSTLVVHEVGVAGAEHLIAGLGEGLQADEVRHPAARHVDRGLRSKELIDPFFEPAGGGVLAEKVIAHLGRRHGLAHLRRREGDGVRAEVDHWRGGHPIRARCRPGSRGGRRVGRHVLECTAEPERTRRSGGNAGSTPAAERGLRPTGPSPGPS